MRTVTSELLRVPGIGPVKRRRLIQEFGSVQGVRDAGEEAIAKVAGFNVEQARKLLETLAANAPV
jgi:excinuclease ABC subunit C